MRETWLPVEGFGGFYEVSNLGRVRSYHGMGGPRRKEGRILRPGATVRGYLFVCLRNGHKVGRNEFVHRLVALAFLGKPPSSLEYPTVNHKDLDRTNNAVSNLEWLGHVENIRHAAPKIPRLRGESHPSSKLTVAQVREIRRRWANRESSTALASEYKVSAQTVWQIATRRKWKTLP